MINKILNPLSNFSEKIFNLLINLKTYEFVLLIILLLLIWLLVISKRLEAKIKDEIRRVKKEIKRINEKLEIKLTTEEF